MRFCFLLHRFSSSSFLLKRPLVSCDSTPHCPVLYAYPDSGVSTWDFCALPANSALAANRSMEILPRPTRRSRIAGLPSLRVFLSTSPLTYFTFKFPPRSSQLGGFICTFLRWDFRAASLLKQIADIGS